LGLIAAESKTGPAAETSESAAMLPFARSRLLTRAHDERASKLAAYAKIPQTGLLPEIVVD
jgi:hypothetical protein